MLGFRNMPCSTLYKVIECFVGLCVCSLSSISVPQRRSSRNVKQARSSSAWRAPSRASRYVLVRFMARVPCVVLCYFCVSQRSKEIQLVRRREGRRAMARDHMANNRNICNNERWNFAFQLCMTREAEFRMHLLSVGLESRLVKLRWLHVVDRSHCPSASGSVRGVSGAMWYN